MIPAGLAIALLSCCPFLLLASAALFELTLGPTGYRDCYRHQSFQHSNPRISLDIQIRSPSLRPGPPPAQLPQYLSQPLVTFFSLYFIARL